VSEPRTKGRSARFHLALTYLLIIWISLGVLMAFLSHYLETSAIGSRMSYLYAQAHLLASAADSRGGPYWGALWDIGGTPARGRVMLVESSGTVADDSARDSEFRGRDLSTIPEIAGALAGSQAANTYYLPDGTFAAYVAVPASWGAVFITQDLGDIVAQYRDIMGAVLVSGIAASVLSLAVAWGLSSVVLGPILELSAIARRMASGRLELRAKPKGPRETRDLAESFNYMASGIEKTMEAHEQFLTAAAHELRSPLAAISATVESMQIQEPEPDELPGLLSDLSGEITRLAHTAEEILDLLRAKGRLENEMCDAVGLVRELVESRRAAAEAKSISLRFSCGEGVAPVHEADGNPAASGSGGARSETVSISPVLLRLVAGNLLDNALKFTGTGGTVEVETSMRGSDFILRVRDTGPGIPESEIPRIFERFYRVDRARRRSTGGAGLGLSIVKEACDRSGGTIRVFSEVGKGTEFEVTWHAVVTQVLHSEKAAKQ
jgi:signal transduction histidine kinase